jgi:hypothetical protein
MRIAISGSHRTGKSTLLTELLRLLPTYTAVDEPYRLLEEDGHDFSYPPSIEEFEAQLERSMEEIHRARDEVLFDRCPIDFLAYIAVHEDGDRFDIGAWLPKVCDAVGTLDLVVFVPIEERDRIAFPASDDAGATRTAVDEELKRILAEDPYDFGVEVVEVQGDPANRARTVLRRLRRDSP